MDGVEIANCYTEETDPAALAALVRGGARREATRRTSHRVGRGVRGRLSAGLSRLHGAALGVDRLEMVFSAEKVAGGGDLVPVFRYSRRTIRATRVKGIT